MNTRVSCSSDHQSSSFLCTSLEFEALDRLPGQYSDSFLMKCGVDKLYRVPDGFENDANNFFCSQFRRQVISIQKHKKVKKKHRQGAHKGRFYLSIILPDKFVLNRLISMQVR